MKSIPYGRHSVDDADLVAIKEALESGWLTTGRLVGEFERALAMLTESEHCVAVNSGTAALHAAYFAAGLSEGDEIVTSPLTFIATASAAVHLGATVRFADVCAATGNIDPENAAAAVNDRTRLLVPVDYAGHPADYTRLQQLTNSTGISLVADAAHSLGASYHGRPVGVLADATTLSFHPVKLLATAEGGAVLTANSEWAQRMRRFRNHGIIREPLTGESSRPAWFYEVEELGFNYRIPDVLCALGLSQLKKTDGFLSRRREIVQRYLDAFHGVAGIELPATEPDVDPAWHLFVLRVEDPSRRDTLFKHLQAAGLGVQLHYRPVYLHSYFRDRGYLQGQCPNAEDFASRAISIPLFPGMADDDVDYVIDTVTAAVTELC